MEISYCIRENLLVTRMIKIGVNHKTIKSRILSPNPIFDNYNFADTNTDEIMPSLPLLIVDDADNH